MHKYLKKTWVRVTIALVVGTPLTIGFPPFAVICFIIYWFIRRKANQKTIGGETASPHPFDDGSDSFQRQQEMLAQSTAAMNDCIETNSAMMQASTDAAMSASMSASMDAGMAATPSSDVP